MLHEREYYRNITESFGPQSALGIALVDTGRSEVIDATYADMPEIGIAWSGRHVMRWVETLPNLECRDRLKAILDEYEAAGTTQRMEVQS